MNNSLLRLLVILVCVLSLILHFSAENAGIIASSWAHFEQPHNSEAHGDEDHFIPTLSKDGNHLQLIEFLIVRADPGDLSRSIVPQLPPPKSI